jgi:hyperosmotically inducible protein
MKTKIATSCFVISTLLSPVMAYAADGDTDRMHPVTYLKDSIITAKVKTNLADAKMSSLVHIQVDTDAKGAVSLSGTVRTPEQATQAVAIARGTSGVTSVVSSLTVKKDD